ncbi:hypothetical protein EN35_27745 [Rhodococcus qingshengii]|nr:hypothetical protein EN35_27745 [Rhodococcus qingshengii]
MRDGPGRLLPVPTVLIARGAGVVALAARELSKHAARSSSIARRAVMNWSLALPTIRHVEFLSFEVAFTTMHDSDVSLI